MYIPSQHPSRRTKDLTGELQHTIGEFRHRNPKVTNDEIRLALQNVTPGTRWTIRRRAALVATASFVAAAAGAWGVANERLNQGRAVPWIAVGTFMALGLAVVAMMWLRTRDD